RASTRRPRPARPCGCTPRPHGPPPRGVRPWGRPSRQVRETPPLPCATAYPGSGLRNDVVRGQVSESRISGVRSRLARVAELETCPSNLDTAGVLVRRPRLLPLVLLIPLLALALHGPAVRAQVSGPATAEPADSTSAGTTRPTFDVWLQDVREEALARGISPATVTAALSDVAPVEQILERDRSQAEFTETL